MSMTRQRVDFRTHQLPDYQGMHYLIQDEQKILGNFLSMSWIIFYRTKTVGFFTGKCEAICIFVKSFIF